MRKFILLLIIHIFLVTTAGLAQSYGLRFSSHEVVQEKRTTLNLTSSGPLCLKKNAELSFDLNFIPYKETYFGYIFRAIDGNNQNIDLIYNQRERNFNFVIGESFSKAFTVDSVTLHTKYMHFAIRFDIDKQEAAIYINDKLITSGPAKLSSPLCERIFFGTNSFEGFQTVDIPPMNIRDIRIKEGDKLKYNWPLSENTGNTATDAVEGKVAAVKNANWIGPRHQNWNLVHSLEIQGNPSVTFDRNKEVLYMVSADTLYSISFKSEEQKAVKLTQRLDSLMPGGQSVFNPFNNKLYNFYIDQKKIGAYDTTTRRWDVSYTPDLLTIYWQANKFVSKADSSLYILCGYGQMQYKNTVQRYQFSNQQWDSIPTKGERLTPRYMAAVGANENGDTAYILGGYGSNSGNQVVNPRHYYDLVAFSVKDHSFSRIYQFPEPQEQFCFANSMVIDPETNNYYALIFPNDKFNTSLQLIEGNFTEPKYTPLGNTIPYSFHDIKSFADLYYCKESNKLVAVTLYTSKDNITEVKAYTLEFPPNAIASATVVSSGIPKWYYLLILIPLGLILYFVRSKRKVVIPAVAVQPQPAAQRIENKPVIATPSPVVQESQAVSPSPEIIAPVAEAAPIPEAEKKSQVYFFGPFEAIDKDGQDITKFFTPLLKELYLLIAIYTIRSGKGITSERLYATLWRDKSNKEAQNNRSVNMVKLKAILDKLGVCSFVKEADRWSLQYDSAEIRMDLADFQHWVQGPRPLSRQAVSQLLRLLHRGSFLPDANYTWLEDIQSEISNISLDILTEAATQFKSDTELLIEIADSIFLFDPVNEDALRMKCSSLVSLGRHSLAKAAFNKFAKEYQHMYGEDFPHTFNEYSME